MPKWSRPYVFPSERFGVPQTLSHQLVGPDPEPRFGFRFRVLFEVLRAQHVYYLRGFEGGRPTTHFASAGTYYAGNFSIYDLKAGTPRGANLVSGETVLFGAQGRWPSLTFTFMYYRNDKLMRPVARIIHRFSLDDWSSVRIEVVCDGRVETLALTKYYVR